MWRILLVFLALAPFLGGCGSCPKDPTLILQPNDTAQCGAACAHLVTLGCPEGQPLGDGTSCEKFCVDTQQAGHALAPSCIVTIKACPELAKCQAPRVLGP